MVEIDVPLMVKLNHILSLKHFWVKFRKEGKYDVYISPINKGYDKSRDSEMFKIIVDYYKELGFDAMIDESLMCYHLYKVS